MTSRLQEFTSDHLKNIHRPELHRPEVHRPEASWSDIKKTVVRVRELDILGTAVIIEM